MNDKTKQSMLDASDKLLLFVAKLGIEHQLSREETAAMTLAVGEYIAENPDKPLQYYVDNPAGVACPVCDQFICQHKADAIEKRKREPLDRPCVSTEDKMRVADAIAVDAFLGL